MGMTVKQLIKALQKKPVDAKVVVADHDHNSEGGEYNGTPKNVWEASELMRVRGYGVVIQL